MAIEEVKEQNRQRRQTAQRIHFLQPDLARTITWCDGNGRNGHASNLAMKPELREMKRLKCARISVAPSADDGLVLRVSLSCDTATCGVVILDTGCITSVLLAR
jgi:hypothetical protein